MSCLTFTVAVLMVAVIVLIDVGSVEWRRYAIYEATSPSSAKPFVRPMPPTSPTTFSPASQPRGPGRNKFFAFYPLPGVVDLLRRNNLDKPVQQTFASSLGPKITVTSPLVLLAGEDFVDHGHNPGKENSAAGRVDVDRRASFDTSYQYSGNYYDPAIYFGRPPQRVTKPQLTPPPPSRYNSRKPLPHFPPQQPQVHPIYDPRQRTGLQQVFVAPNTLFYRPGPPSMLFDSRNWLGLVRFPSKDFENKFISNVAQLTQMGNKSFTLNTTPRPNVASTTLEPDADTEVKVFEGHVIDLDNLTESVVDRILEEKVHKQSMVLAEDDKAAGNESVVETSTELSRGHQSTSTALPPTTTKGPETSSEVYPVYKATSEVYPVYVNTNEVPSVNETTSEVASVNVSVLESKSKTIKLEPDYNNNITTTINNNNNNNTNNTNNINNTQPLQPAPAQQQNVTNEVNVTKTVTTSEPTPPKQPQSSIILNPNTTGVATIETMLVEPLRVTFETNVTDAWTAEHTDQPQPEMTEAMFTYKPKPTAATIKLSDMLQVNARDQAFCAEHGHADMLVYFPSSNCKYYLICAGPTYFRVECNRNSLFDKYQKKCVPEYLAKCVDGV